jgi:hypothetical protein
MQHWYKLLHQEINVIINNVCGKFLDVASCKKGPEISRPTDTFQIQHVVKKDMALEIIF